jgi:4-hydroxy-3-methylbut-2-en-1-yl diphosphate synthase IspG/GcpE
MTIKKKRKCDVCRKSKRSVQLRLTNPDVYCCPACYRMLVKVTAPQPLS